MQLWPTIGKFRRDKNGVGARYDGMGAGAGAGGESLAVCRKAKKL